MRKQRHGLEWLLSLRLHRVREQSAPYCEHNRGEESTVLRAIVILTFPKIQVSTCAIVCVPCMVLHSFALPPSPLWDTSDAHASLLNLVAEFAAIPTSLVSRDRVENSLALSMVFGDGSRTGVWSSPKFATIDVIQFRSIESAATSPFLKLNYWNTVYVSNILDLFIFFDPPPVIKLSLKLNKKNFPLFFDAAFAIIYNYKCKVRNGRKLTYLQSE